MRKLIPNNINIIEQLRIRDQFVYQTEQWCQSIEIFTNKPNLEWLETNSGVRCHYTNNGVLAGFKVVDEKSYVMWLLRWA